MIVVATTGHFFSEYMGQALLQGVPNSIKKLVEECKTENRVISYGHLRGSYECLIKAAEYWHIDHGYMSPVKRIFIHDKLTRKRHQLTPSKLGTKEFDDSYFRISHNAFFNSGIGNYPSDRFARLNIKIKKRKRGSKILLVPPLEGFSARFYQVSNWLKNTIDEIKKYSDRKIIISNKFDIKKASDYFNETFCLVTYHSNTGIDAIINGIPCIFTNPQRQFSKISEIENPPYSEKILYNLAYAQWNIHEIRSGEAWSFLSKKNINL
jgi:hypothetical protein